jgi:type IV pilus assembly protein PilE
MKNGFSLIEMLCVLGLIGLLTTFAYPSYTKHLLHAKQIDGRSALLDLAARLEQYHQQAGTYQTATLGTGKITDLLSLRDSPGGWYELQITEATEHYYALEATPKSIKEKLPRLMLDANGYEEKI